jgi:hypothetical protein
MKISVRNYRALQHADLECASIALVGGPNEAGKSSLAEAVAAALTGVAVPKHLELQKKDIRELMHHGAATASVAIIGQEGESRMAWPDCQLSASGSAPPRATPYAAGVVSLIDLKPDDRAAVLYTYLRAEPTREDLIVAMADSFLPASIETVWKELETDGWDAVAARYVEARRNAGRDWAKLTGEQHGSDKAKNWEPPGWDPGLAGMTVEELQALVAEAAAAVETAIAGAAVDDSVLARLRGLAEQLDDRTAVLDDAMRLLQEAAATMQAARSGRDRLPAVAPDNGTECPHCHKPVLIVGPTLEKFVGVDAETNAKRKAAISDAEALISRAAMANQKAQMAAVSARTAVDEAAAAKRALDEQAGRRGSAGEVARARDTLALRSRDLEMVQRREAAAKLARDWQRANLLADLLGQGGLRARKTGEAIEAMNVKLASLCEVAGWPLVRITAELGIRYGDRAASLVSDGARFRIRATLQIAMAQIDKSSMVVIDKADVLDVAGRNGLFRVLLDLGLPALVCMTTLRDPPPNLAGHGGATWVIEGARARRLDDPAQAAA